MGSVSKQLKQKLSKAQTSKKIIELSTFAGVYATELGNLLVQKGLITDEEEHEVANTAMKQTQQINEERSEIYEK